MCAQQENWASVCDMGRFQGGVTIEALSHVHANAALETKTSTCTCSSRGIPTTANPTMAESCASRLVPLLWGLWGPLLWGLWGVTDA